MRCLHEGCAYEAETNLHYCRGHEGGFVMDMSTGKMLDPPLTQKHDPVSAPSHYRRGKIETIDSLESFVAGLDGVEAGLTWSAAKYLARWKHKAGLEDLRKCRWYLDRLIAHVEGES